AVVTKYIDALRPLKAVIKRLEGRGQGGYFGAITKIILVFKYILTYYKQRVKAYKAINYNAHDKAPKDYFTTNLRVAWAKANAY
ncbi:hypothetical protein BU23DRAFT_427516, partial [Bimuria novae-zelandiae CBS 107.79]